MPQVNSTKHADSLNQQGLNAIKQYPKSQASFWKYFYRGAKMKSKIYKKNIESLMFLAPQGKI